MSFTAGDGNLTRYVSNNPTNSIDPTGLRQTEVFMSPGVPASLSLEIDPDIFAFMAAPVEREREMQFAVVYRDSPTPLVVGVFMDDIDAPNICFLTSAELAEKITNERDAFQ